MPLTPAQLQTLKGHIAANTATVLGTPINQLPMTTDANVAIAGWYNQTATPAYYVYRTGVAIDEIMSNGFDWTRVDNATVGKARIWEWMARIGVIDPSKANIRAGINEAWSGTGADIVAHRLAIFAHCQTTATNVVKLFATGAGTTITNVGAGPAVPAFVGPVTADEVEAARQLV